MKISLFIHSLATGGAERVTCALANYWDSCGHDISIITIESSEYDRYPLSHGVARKSLHLGSDSRHLLDAVTANVQRVRALRNLLVADRPDVVVAMSSTCNVLLALASVGLKNITCVGSERVHPPRVALPRMWESLRAVTYRNLHAVVAQTADSGDWVRKHTSARSTCVIPNPVVWPLPATEPVRDPSTTVTAGRRIVLGVGRLVDQKGFDMLVDAFAKLHPRFPEWQLVLVGEGAQREALQTRIDRHGAGNAITLAGAVGNVGDWYARADIFVLSSRFEGFPNVLVEAMSHGLAVVSFDCETGPREIIHNDVDGLLVPDRDTAALEAALERLMAQPQTRARIAARAIEVRGRFSLDNVGTQWLKLFQQLAKAKRNESIIAN